MQQALDAWPPRAGMALAMRVGLSAGDVTFENDDCFGTPVIEASRLCALADPGQILVAELVRLLARGRSELELTPCGPMTLKGLPEPVDVFAVQWEPAERSSGLCTSTPYVGHERERDTLAERSNAAATGTGGLVLIAGEPGMGKTRLIKELSEHVVRPSGGTVLSGGCHDGDVAANVPFVEAFTEWGAEASAPDELARALRSGGGGRRAHGLGGRRRAPGRRASRFPRPADAEIAASCTTLICQVLLRLAETAPVLLVVDDLHFGRRRDRRDALRAQPRRHSAAGSS